MTGTLNGLEVCIKRLRVGGEIYHNKDKPCNPLGRRGCSRQAQQAYPDH